MSDFEVGFDRPREVGQILDEDDTRLGEIWRRHRAGESVTQIALEYEVTTAPVHAYLGVIRSLRDGELTTSPAVASRHASRIRSWLKKKSLSPALRSALEAQESALNAVASDVSSREEEDQAAAAETKRVLAEGRPGVYVYTLPHYLRYPFDPSTKKTLLKVGHSASDAFYRASSQGRLTALPEDPVLLRIYLAEESAEIERKFHEWLRAADHAQSEARRGGTEWFVTSTRFLDQVARSLSLEIIEFNEALDPLED